MKIKIQQQRKILRNKMFSLSMVQIMLKMINNLLYLFWKEKKLKQNKKNFKKALIRKGKSIQNKKTMTEMMDKQN